MSGRSIRVAIGVLGTVVGRRRRVDRDERRQAAAAGLLHLAIGLTYLYGGLAIWDHEPANRTGRLMTAVGLTWFIGTLDRRRRSRPVTRSPSRSRTRPRVILLALVLAYPSGRLETRVDRVAVAVLAIGATTLNILYSTSLPLIADKSQRPVRRPGPRRS